MPKWSKMCWSARRWDWSCWSLDKVMDLLGSPSYLTGGHKWIWVSDLALWPDVVGSWDTLPTLIDPWLPRAASLEEYWKPPSPLYGSAKLSWDYYETTKIINVSTNYEVVCLSRSFAIQRLLRFDFSLSHISVGGSPMASPDLNQQ